jgi:hypothetical protein
MCCEKIKLQKNKTKTQLQKKNAARFEKDIFATRVLRRRVHSLVCEHLAHTTRIP